MIRRPPRSTLFPYNDALPISPIVPVVFRTRAGLGRRPGHRGGGWVPGAATSPWGHIAAVVARGDVRSEEHTSELQSHLNLVCRLLLEKKKHSRTVLQNASLDA